MAMLLETPSRIWRRIEAADDNDMPSLPSISGFEDSNGNVDPSSDGELNASASQLLIHSTPAASLSRVRSSSSSTTRLVNSFGRSSSASRLSSRQTQLDNLDASPIPHTEGNIQDDEDSKESVPEVYLPPDDLDEFSIADALQSIDSPYNDSNSRKQRYSDYMVPLRPEPQPSPFDKFKNISLRRPVSRTRARTPSLTRTTGSAESSSTNSTPKSTHLQSEDSPPPSPDDPPAIEVHSADASAVESEHELSRNNSDTRSMDITEAHISPVRDLRSEEETAESGAESAHDDEREPTFSSEGDETHKASSASAAFTPTPAFPRPRARFSTSSDHMSTPMQTYDDDPLTPHTRRRSFLLSVINSTTRPRLKVPTPHPRNKMAFPETPKTGASTPQSSESTPQAANLQTAFAGVTPRPRIRAGRMSHPLVQAFTASSGTSDSESPETGTETQAWATPGLNLSPYDGAGDRASFISTASSHDLTTHHRANTSFDPAMGFGNGGQGGVGRFNATKLNNYLHGLNRRLQEENEVLIEKLRQLEEEHGSSASTSASSSRRLSAGASRRISAGGTLANVAEDVGGEGWVEEKAELEAMVDAFKVEAEKYQEDKVEAEKALEEERAGRVRDKERWQDRMAEVEEGVKGIVVDLEQKLQNAEALVETAERASAAKVQELERILIEVEGQRDDAMDRASVAEHALQSGKDLGGELKDAHERVSQLMGDLRNANAQIKQLEQEVLRSDERIDELERDLKEEKALAADLDKELNSKLDDLDVQRQRIQESEEIAQKLGEQLTAVNAYTAELEYQVEAAVERVDSLETEASAAQQQLQKARASNDVAAQRMTQLEVEAQTSSEQVQQMQEALEVADKKMQQYEMEVADLRTQLSSMEREKERSIARDPSQIHASTEAEVEGLETELNDAYREIARLNAILNQSPARKAIDKAKDTKIEILEKENEVLVERIKILRTTADTGTPSRIFNSNAGISPLHRRVLSMSFHAPNTPGAPLKDLSWLNATANDPSVTPLLAEISRLQRELDNANNSIDDKLDKLEEAGLGVVGLTRKLEDAREEIIRLGDEIARLSRREERRTRRLERARCRKCLLKIDLSGLDADESSLQVSRSHLPDEPPTPPTRTSGALRKDLQKANDHLSSMKKDWDEEKRRLLGEKAVLQEAANRLNIQIQDAKSQASKAVEAQKAGQKLRDDADIDLARAKGTIAELEQELKSERARLRSMQAEQTKVQREREDVLLQLQRIESDMEDVKKQMHKYKKENSDMENELRMNANAEQKARLLEARVNENAETINQLREERAILVSDHKALQQRFAEITTHANRLREECAVSQQSHDHRRNQLDIQLAEIEDLRKALSSQADELHRAETEKRRITSEKNDVSQTVAALQADLRRVRKDAEAFGRDLKLLRSEKEKLEAKQKQDLTRAERFKRQAETQIRLLNEQLESQRSKALTAKEELQNHICAMDDRQLSALKLRHNKECKGLIVQINYLKAKFTRESAFRSDLQYQKHYLLVLLARFEKSDQTILAAVAKIGFPLLSAPPVKKRRKLKSLALCVVFLARIRHSSNEWRKHTASKTAIAAALEEVRRNRVQT